MPTIVPHGELLKRAMTHVSEGLSAMQARGEAPSRAELCRLVEEAAARCNLSPLEGEFLMTFFLEDPRPGEQAK